MAGLVVVVLLLPPEPPPEEQHHHLGKEIMAGEMPVMLYLPTPQGVEVEQELQEPTQVQIMFPGTEALVWNIQFLALRTTMQVVGAVGFTSSRGLVALEEQAGAVQGLVVG